MITKNETKIPTMITMAETKKMYGLSRNFLKQLCEEKKIVHVHCGVKVLINADSLTEYLSNFEEHESG